MMKNVQTVKEYAGEERGSQAALARKEGVGTPQITQWIKKKFIVVDGVLYSPRRVMKGPTHET